MPVVFEKGNAAHPPYAPASCDVIVARHVLWALPQPAAALQQWTSGFVDEETWDQAHIS
jgi:hypothetical protein